jgi:hypothetical protein
MKWKQTLKRSVITLGLIVGVVILFGLFVWTGRNTNSLYPDFTRFSTPSDLEAYLRTILTIGQTDQTALNDFLKREYRSHWDRKDTYHPARDELVRLEVLAPDNCLTRRDMETLTCFLYESFVPSTYKIYLQMTDSVLTSIVVERHQPYMSDFPDR